jgi:hypothetical protein
MQPFFSQLALFAAVFPLLAFQPAAPRAYKNPSLHLALLYPANLEPEDPANPDAYSYRTRFALHPDSDPEAKGADPCSPLLLAAGMGPDQPIDAHKAKPGRVVPLQPTGGLTLNQIKHSCLVQDDPQSTDEKSIAALVENARHIAGLHPIAHTLSYEIPGAQVLFAASSGPTADEKGHRTPSAGLTYTGTAGILAGTRLFLVSFTANNLATFNGMLAAKICLDAPACATGYGTLVPYRLTPQGEVQATQP